MDIRLSRLDQTGSDWITFASPSYDEMILRVWSPPAGTLTGRPVGSQGSPVAMFVRTSAGVLAIFVRNLGTPQPRKHWSGQDHEQRRLLVHVTK